MDKIILLINRDADFLDQTGAILKKAGYAFQTASDMRGSLSVLSSHTAGLIICDKQLLDVSGLDLLNFIKKDPLRENIPFMFLVPAADQLGAFKAFELGAAEYLVYPIEPELIIGRIKELFCAPEEPAASLPAGAAVESPAPAGKAPPPEKAVKDPVPITAFKVDISRDGVIWLPGKIVNFAPQHLFIETALFGKPGVSLMIRAKLDEGTFLLNGYIKAITYDDFQKPAALEITMQEEESWRRVRGELGETALPAGVSSADPEMLEKTIILAPVRPEKTVYQTGPFQPSAARKPSYDLRFYHSIIGKQLDNYRAITLIGAGSMGGVIQGWDVALEREVALKVISYELSSKDKFREMFIREARVVSRLNHNNIAQIYYIGTSNDILYYAMEFVDGKTLKDLIAREGNLNTLKGLEYLITVCEALYYVHQNSIVHRDMKPANIMINFAGVVKIVDFGVAMSARNKGEKSMVMGSPLYMSPEQVAGLTLDHRSDIYSVGATFYHIFTGSPPFEDDDFKVIMSNHIQKPLPPMKDKNPRIPSALAQIIEKMMAKDPFDRYKDFQAVAGDVKNLHARILERKRRQPLAAKAKTIRP